MLRYTLRQLEYLAACVDTGSLVAAAQRLNVSQPSISTAIAKLEEQLGTQLLIRHHAQGVVPAANARRVIQNARDLLAHANDFQNAIRISEGEISGELTLGSFISLAPTYLPGLIMSLREKFPDLELKIGEGTQDLLVSGLRNGEFETVLVYDFELPDDVQKTELLELRPQVLLHQDHPLAEKSEIALAELADEPLILLDIQPSRQYFTGLFEDTGTSPKIGYRSSSIELVRGLVGRGLGYSLLVTRPPGDLTYDGQQLAIRPIQDDVEKTRIVLCRLKSVRPTAALLELENFALTYFMEHASSS